MQMYTLTNDHILLPTEAIHVTASTAQGDLYDRICIICANPAKSAKKPKYGLFLSQQMCPLFFIYFIWKNLAPKVCSKKKFQNHISAFFADFAGLHIYPYIYSM